MLTTATLANRYTMLPNQRVVTITPQNPLGTAIPSINGVVRRPWTKQEVQMLGAGIEAETAAFIIPKATFTAAVAALAAANPTAAAVSRNATVPRNGWQITDDESNTWTIQSVTRELEGTMFRCPCILNIAEGTRQ